MSSTKKSAQSSQIWDAMAVGLSGLCIVHCLALPLLVLALPMLGSLSENEWVHRLLIGAALPVSLLAVTRSGQWHRWDVALPGLLGLILLGIAAFVSRLEVYEVPMSVVGATFLAFAHLRNGRFGHRHSKVDP